ncbi:MAG TPA: hypothetical protein VGR28_07115, partial [Candidatus Thermoplasmatota archaeon]|nr:hypothetical protein [Candidatus Thermoplasmatota archaeon]
VGGTGRIALAYLGSTDSPGQPWPQPKCGQDMCLVTNPTITGYENTTWNGYLTTSADASSADPLFFTSQLNPPGDPLVRGLCQAVNCPGFGDFLDVRIAPDGTAWAPFVDVCTGACVQDAKGTPDRRELVAGRLWGGASLWDEGQAAQVFGGGAAKP